jgi:Bacterial PH domain
MAFKSAVDWWYYVLIVVVGFVVMFSVVPPMQSGELSLLFGAAIIILSLCLPVWLLFSTNYRTDAKSLYIRSGPFSWTIPLAEIESVTPSRSLWSSPALSLDRLEVRYSGGKQILVSPRDRELFIDALTTGMTQE